MGNTLNNKKQKEAKMAITKFEKIKKKMEDLNNNPINPGLEKMISFIKKNGPTTVSQLADNFKVADTKAIRRPFQKAGLKQGNWTIEIGKDTVTLDKRTGKNIYQVH
tara:strand:+ start:138 stop:458 length:321 start_codon:yes stop_codon:yes gene_type:complete